MINQKGNSLFETMAAIAIGAVLTMVGVSVYSKAMAKAKVVAATYLPEESSHPEFVLGPYDLSQFFPEANKNSHIFLGDECIDDLVCRRSFCGQVEIKDHKFVYVHVRNVTHCITQLAKS